MSEVTLWMHAVEGAQEPPAAPSVPGAPLACQARVPTTGKSFQLVNALVVLWQLDGVCCSRETQRARSKWGGGNCPHLSSHGRIQRIIRPRAPPRRRTDDLPSSSPTSPSGTRPWRRGRWGTGRGAADSLRPLPRSAGALSMAGRLTRVALWRDIGVALAVAAPPLLILRTLRDPEIFVRVLLAGSSMVAPLRDGGSTLLVVAVATPRALPVLSSSPSAAPQSLDDGKALTVLCGQARRSDAARQARLTTPARESKQQQGGKGGADPRA